MLVEDIDMGIMVEVDEMVMKDGAGGPPGEGGGETLDGVASSLGNFDLEPDTSDDAGVLGEVAEESTFSAAKPGARVARNITLETSASRTTVGRVVEWLSRTTSVGGVLQCELMLKLPAGPVCCGNIVH